MLVVSKSSRGFDTVACGLFDGSKVLKLRFAMNKGVQTFCSKVSFLPEKRVHSVMGVPFRYRKLERKKPRLPVKNILPHIYVKKLCVSRPKIIPAVKKVFTNPRKQSEFDWDWRVWGICENFFHR